MRLTTKFSAFVTLLTGLTIFVTLLGCSLSFYNAIQYKFSHRVQAVATAIDTHLVSNDFSTLRPQITELMMSADIVRVDLLHGDKQVYTLARNGSYRPVGSSDLFRELSVPLIKHPGMSLRLVYQDPMGNYFHSLMTTAPLTGAIGFIIVMLFLAVRWLQRQLAGQELLETRATRILNGERGSNVLGTIYEWPPRTSSALDTLLREIQNAREQHSRLDTLIRSYAAQDVKTGLNNRLFFDNQLATLLEDQEKVGTHGIVMMIRLPDFNMLSDTWGHSQVEEQFFTLTNLLSTFMMRYPGALLARYHRGNVRWRTLIEQMLSRGGPRLYQKPAVTREGQVHHRELMCRIFDGNEEVSSAEYMPMVLQFGLSEEYDRLQISRLIPLLRYWPEENLAIQVTVESLIRPRFQRWLRDTLMQCEKSQRKRIIIELAEADVGQHISRLQPVIRLVNALGVRVAVNQAGLTLVSTSWIKELNVELLKLHPGLVRNIEKRTENQLLVQSLVEACSGTSTQVYATGVRSRSEWQTLIQRGVTGGQGDFFASSQPLDTNVKKYSQRYSV
ncbi:TPA: RNase E specificity factor CsrD [Escherichia coli]|nr:RNase E specificity factor CsrD [Escherichia coli]